jgi:hypothetical protein
MMLILHLIACFLGAASQFNTDSDKNWLIYAEIYDADNIRKYITSLYWAAMTVITVGYGDIYPQNNYETMLICGIIIVGVALFSYTLSTLSSQFSDLGKSVSKRQVIDQLINNYNIEQR